ncbi:aarF domain-containing protein kinase 1 isoform X8 [Mirounga angustirostris]|uniref:aarF domain-containing protein kinase 1 isoform X5 n=1 Tax=Mirounga leonina TaxID=9715 RepID=UPI00156C3FF7|nr:aarF domain-containing protein kinase 1 isoform X5 [Mirounga leonina]XP_054369797.1 aarF domain-containing protein kinase 1 isoform X4 [Mirounga angustirostris]
MARRALKLASWTSAALAASGFYLYSNKYLDPSDFGAVRVGRAVATTAVISYDYLTSLRSVPYGSEEYLQLRSKVHLRSARRLFELCCANRGTFIKVGQHLGALDYLLPEEYTSTLKVLHSQAPQSSIQEVRQVIREDLGQEIQDLFVSFDDTPLGAASLAQVHKAVLRDGRTVAVKVQHPKVQAQSSKDILLMEVLVLAVKQLFPEFEFMWLVDEAKKNLPLELDFLNEGRNAEKVAQMLKHFDFLKISCHLGKMYSEMIFVNGFVHCDPHPGNVLVRKRPDTGKAEIVLLDHGLYQVLTDEFRLDYCHLWQSLIWTDMEKVKKYSQRLGAGELYPLFACMLTARSWDSVNKGIGQASVTATEDAEIRNNAASYLPQISQLLNHVPRQMLLIFKTNDLLRGIEVALGTRARASSFLSMSRCCIRALAAHKKKNTCSFFRRTQISFREAFSLWQINLHELILCVKELRLATWVLALLRRLLPTSY